MEKLHHIKLTTRQTFVGILILPSHNLYNIESDMDNLSGFSANASFFDFTCKWKISAWGMGSLKFSK